MSKQLNFRFPKLKFWDRQTPKITFINEGDFWQDELLSKLGLTKNHLISSMGSSDRKEVLRRQSILRTLFENPQLRTFIKNGIKTDIPTDGQGFLDEFNPEKAMSSFTEKVYELITLLENINSATPLTEDATILLSFLKETITDFKESERQFGLKVGEEIEKASKLHGRTTVQIDTSVDGVVFGFTESGMEEQGYGYRHFSFRLSNRFRLILDPKSYQWKEHPNWRVVWIVLSVIIFPIGLYILWHNYRLNQLAFKPMIIEKVPNSLKRDIIEGLKQILLHQPNAEYNKLSKEKARLEQEKKNKEAAKIELPPTFPNLSIDNLKTFIELYYTYDRRGLSIRIIRAYCQPEKLFHYNTPFYETDFKGYSASYVQKIQEESRKLENDAVQQTYQYANITKVLGYVQKTQETLFGTDGHTIIPSPKTDIEFKYYTVEEIKNLPQVAYDYETVRTYRSFVSETVRELHSLVDTLEAVIDCSERWKIPLEFPTILPDDEHVIGFETIYPIHLIGREAPNKTPVKPENLVAITSLPPLNGQMVGLTGQNGGGKTATINELSYLIFLAQSGLPVFGKGVHLNVKKTIGLVFNTRGEGSQLQNFLNKSMNVLKTIKGLSSNSTVIMLDELGSGAQNQDGIELGKKILKALHKSGVSTIYNTQLPEVAEYSQNELGAICFKFTLDHQVRKGIGAGGASLLAKEIGIDKYFV